MGIFFWFPFCILCCRLTKMLWFLNIAFAWCCFLKFTYSVEYFFGGVNKIFHVLSDLHVNNDCFTSSTSRMLFISFSCLFTVAKTSRLCWIEVVTVDILVFVLILVGKVLGFAHCVWCLLYVLDVFYEPSCMSRSRN